MANYSNKIPAFILLGVMFCLGLVLLLSGLMGERLQEPAGRVVVPGESGDVQVVNILAKNGFSPDYTVAKAGRPTRVQLETRDTQDCARSVFFPSLNIEMDLPPSGVAPVDIPPQEKGAVVVGRCKTGPASFILKFE